MNLGTSQKEFSHTNMTVQTIGHFIVTSNSWNLPIKEILKEEGVSFVDVSKNDLKNKSLYRTSKIRLPRNKLDLLKTELGLSVTRSMDKCDYIVTSESFITDAVTNSWGKFLTLDDVEKLFASNAFKSMIPDHVSIPFTQLLPDDGVFELNFDHSWGHSMQNEINSMQNLVREIDSRDRYTWYVKENMYKDYKAITSCGNLVKDSRIVELCNSNLHVLSEEEFKSFNTIFKESSSDDDKSMALEMMANCNLDKCLDKVTFLYYMHYETLRCCKNWNHINVKTLRKALIDPRYSDDVSIHYEKLSKFLIEKNMFSEFIVKEILALIVNQGIRRFGFNQGMFELDPQDIKISEKYKSAIVKNESGENIIDTILAGDILSGSDNLLF
jgi:hypothetical protein